MPPNAPAHAAHVTSALQHGCWLLLFLTRSVWWTEPAVTIFGPAFAVLLAAAVLQRVALWVRVRTNSVVKLLEAATQTRTFHGEDTD